MALRLMSEQSPRYVRAKEAILEFIQTEIENGALVDNRLPAEDKLCQMLGVSRPTVREALMALSRESIISKLHGTGNLIHRSTLNTRMRFDQFSDFSDLLQNNGHEVELRRTSYCPTTKEGCKILAAVGGNCEGSIFQEAAYYADGKLTVLVYNFLFGSMRMLSELGDSSATMSFPALLEALTGEELSHSVVHFMPDVANEKIAARFSIDKGTPITKLKESHYSVFDHLSAESVVFFNPTAEPITTLREW